MNIVSYIGSWQTVADIHFEAARITKRAAWSFYFLLEDRAARGTDRLRHLGNDLFFVGITRTLAEREEQEPLSARRHGGALSSVRPKIAQKLDKTSPQQREALSLIFCGRWKLRFFKKLEEHLMRSGRLSMR